MLRVNLAIILRSAETATATKMSLADPNESLEVKRHRVQQLVENVHSVLMAAEEAEVSAAEASQLELTDEKVVLIPLSNLCLQCFHTVQMP